MTQNKQILNYLQKGYKLTPLDALSLFGCFRLSARIYDLKALGHKIEKRIVTNKGKSFAQYYIKEKK